MSNSQRLLSVCIPTYDMRGKGQAFLKQSLDILAKQTFKDFDIIISDYSTTDAIKDLCGTYKQVVDIKYFKNTDPTGGWAANANNAIKHGTGEILKILFQDDFLYDEHSLQITVDHFDLTKDQWLVTGCQHTRDGQIFLEPHVPTFSQDMHLGNNTIGAPSVMTIRNGIPFLFDTRLRWLGDCDYYQRLAETFGAPRMINDITAVIRLGDHQITNTEATEAVRKKELAYVRRKFQHRARAKARLDNVTVVAVTGIGTAGAVKALELCLDGLAFHDAVLIAHNKPEQLDERITFKKCKPSELTSQDRKNTNDYSKFMLYNLQDYIDSEFALIVHNDAYILRPEKWENDFLKYDYIGAPWPPQVHFTNDGTNVRVGNGGFSLRSKKMIRALNELKLPFTDNGTGFYHEDGVICVYHRKQLEQHGLTFAPVDIASRFSHEVDCEDSVQDPFGFHNTKSVIPKFFQLKHRLRKILRRA